MEWRGGEGRGREGSGGEERGVKRSGGEGSGGQGNEGEGSGGQGRAAEGSERGNKWGFDISTCSVGVEFDMIWSSSGYGKFSLDLTKHYVPPT